MQIVATLRKSKKRNLLMKHKSRRNHSSQMRICLRELRLKDLWLSNWRQWKLRILTCQLQLHRNFWVVLVMITMMMISKTLEQRLLLNRKPNSWPIGLYFCLPTSTASGSFQSRVIIYFMVKQLATKNKSNTMDATTSRKTQQSEISICCLFFTW